MEREKRSLWMKLEWRGGAGKVSSPGSKKGGECRPKKAGVGGCFGEKKRGRNMGRPRPKNRLIKEQHSKIPKKRGWEGEGLNCKRQWEGGGAGGWFFIFKRDGGPAQGPNLVLWGKLKGGQESKGGELLTPTKKGWGLGGNPADFWGTVGGKETAKGGKGKRWVGGNR